MIIYYKENLNEGLIGIIASRLKDYFNKPSIVITKSSDKLKASARSTESYNIGYLIKSLVDNKIIDSGGGHNMAAGFTIKENNLKFLNDFIQKDFKKKNFYNKDNMDDIEIVKATTETGFKRNSFIYDFMSSMRQKINDPLGQRAKKRKEISQR